MTGRAILPVLVLAAGTILAATCAPAHAGETGPVVSHAWVRAAPPVVRTHAGYLTLENPGSEPIEIVGVDSPQYESAQIHMTEVKGGIATMTRQDQVEVPPYGRLVMAPGGFHIMLVNPKRPASAGDTIEIVLRLANGGRIAVKAPVRRNAAPSGGHGHEQGHEHGAKGTPKTH